MAGQLRAQSDPTLLKPVVGLATAARDGLQGGESALAPTPELGTAAGAPVELRQHVNVFDYKLDVAIPDGCPLDLRLILAVTVLIAATCGRQQVSPCTVGRAPTLTAGGRSCVVPRPL